ncbi:MAG: four helix bundle protein [Planctomycetota bacterium]
MSAYLSDRPPAREAGPELQVLARWEEHTGWLLQHTARWPKSARFTLCQRVQNHALDVTEMLVAARYRPGERARALAEANLRLERLRLLLRLAVAARVMPKRSFETAMRGIDEAGRRIHRWRATLRSRPAAEAQR